MCKISMLLEELCQRYREGERDFRGINLRESDLTNIALPGVNFCRADLRQARLGKIRLARSLLRAG